MIAIKPKRANKQNTNKHDNDLLSFRFDPFARTKIQKYFRSFMVQMQTLKLASEIY